MNIYIGLEPCKTIIYHTYPWHITMSNSLKSSRFCFCGFPKDFSWCDPYNGKGTCHLVTDMKDYPEINPNNFTETLILYNSSHPHFLMSPAIHITQSSTTHR